ncbi:MAG: SDR family NAD(P)-dependent oxidoreductase [Gemmatimonadales bacterium]
MKRAVVTGGSRGIGKATCAAFEASGVEAIPVAKSTHGDLSDPCTAEQAAEAIGAIDFLVVNHGVWVVEPVSLEKMPPTQWASTVAQNLDSVFYTVRAFGPKIRKGGAVVIVSSTAGQRGEAMHADYAATKGALIALTKSLAIEMAPDVRVNCVAPGWTDTDMAAPALTGGGRRRQIEATIPLGRVASAEDIAGPIVFLCSDMARHITGEILNVNGGSVLCG